jgi:hypothetical protein
MEGLKPKHFLNSLPRGRFAFEHYNTEQCANNKEFEILHGLVNYWEQNVRHQ